MRRLKLLTYYAEEVVYETRDGGKAMRVKYDARKRAGDIEVAGRGQCFACIRERMRLWHHVIQIQHGGSNRPLNRVAICEECHMKIHPWLKANETAYEVLWR